MFAVSHPMLRIVKIVFSRPRWVNTLLSDWLFNQLYRGEIVPIKWLCMKILGAYHSILWQIILSHWRYGMKQPWIADQCPCSDTKTKQGIIGEVPIRDVQSVDTLWIGLYWLCCLQDHPNLSGKYPWAPRHHPKLWWHLIDSSVESTCDVFFTTSSWSKHV